MNVSTSQKFIELRSPGSLHSYTTSRKGGREACRVQSEA